VIEKLPHPHTRDLICARQSGEQQSWIGNPGTDKGRNFLMIRNSCGLRVPEGAMETTSALYSKKYFDRWSHLLTSSPFKGYYRYIARKYEPEFAKYGYSLTKTSIDSEEVFGSGKDVSACFGPIYCLGADLGALLQRFAVRTNVYVKRAVKKVLPQFVLTESERRGRDSGLSKRKAEDGGQRAALRSWVSKVRCEGVLR
jgi:hypothetical protein